MQGVCAEIRSTLDATAQTALMIISIIGAGIMGKGIAANLGKQGHEVRIYSRSPKKVQDILNDQISLFVTPVDCVKGAELTVLCLTDDSVVRSNVLEPGFLSAVRGTVMDVGTTSPDLTLELMNAFRAKQVRFFDAPMTGSKLAARDGKILFMMGGSDEDYMAGKPVFDAAGKSVVRCGKVGDGQRAKIALNMIQAGTLQILIEGFSLAKRLGIQSETMKEILDQSAARSGISDFKLPFVLSRNYETHFSLKNMNKDLNHALHLAMQAGAELPAAFAIKSVFDRAMNQGHAENDYSSIADATYHSQSSGSP